MHSLLGSAHFDDAAVNNNLYYRI